MYFFLLYCVTNLNWELIYLALQWKWDNWVRINVTLDQRGHGCAVWPSAFRFSAVLISESGCCFSDGSRAGERRWRAWRDGGWDGKRGNQLRAPGWPDGYLFCRGPLRQAPASGHFAEQRRVGQTSSHGESPTEPETAAPLLQRGGEVHASQGGEYVPRSLPINGSILPKRTFRAKPSSSEEGVPPLFLHTRCFSLWQLLGVFFVGN